MPEACIAAWCMTGLGDLRDARADQAEPKRQACSPGVARAAAIRRASSQLWSSTAAATASITSRRRLRRTPLSMSERSAMRRRESLVPELDRRSRCAPRARLANCRASSAASPSLPSSRRGNPTPRVSTWRSSISRWMRAHRVRELVGDRRKRRREGARLVGDGEPDSYRPDIDAEDASATGTVPGRDHGDLADGRDEILRRSRSATPAAGDRRA